MAIEGIQNTIMTQVQRVEPVTTDYSKVSPVETAPLEVTPVQGRQTEYDADKDQEKEGQQSRKDDGKNIQDVSPEKVKSAIADINKKIAPTQTSLQFSYHEKTHRISITVRDKQTDKVIREIPPEKTLDMIARSLELEGILVDEKR